MPDVRGLQLNALPVGQELIHSHAEVAAYLAQQDRRDIAPRMKWHSGRAPRSVAKLLVRAALPYLGKAHSEQNRHDFRGLQHWKAAHGSRNSDALHPDEMRLQLRLSVFKEHRNDFLKIVLKLLQRFTLGVRARKARNEADVEARGRVLFNHCRERFHLCTPDNHTTADTDGSAGAKGHAQPAS